MKTSEIKEYLKNAYVRIKPEAMQKILQIQEAHTTALIDEAIVRAKEAKRKTIFVEDLAESKPEAKADAKAPAP